MTATTLKHSDISNAAHEHAQRSFKTAVKFVWKRQTLLVEVAGEHV